MSANVLPPNSCLLAIIFISKTRDGTSEVFHYPPNPGSSRHHRRRRRTSSTASGTVTDASSSSSDDNSDSSSENYDDYAAFEDTVTHSHVRSDSSHANGAHGGSAEPEDESGSTSPEKAGGGGGGGKGDGQVGGGRASGAGNGAVDYLGLPAGFHHFLCPPASLNKRRFELTIDRLVFLGRPAFARDDGTWRKEKNSNNKKDGRRRKTSSQRPESTARTVTSIGGDSVVSSRYTGAAVATAASGRKSSLQLDSLVVGDGGKVTTGQGATSSEAESSSNEQHAAKTDTDGEDEFSGYEAGYGHELDPSEAKKQKKVERERTKEALSMFNVVFVMNPSPIEYQRRVDDMYRFVVKKFARALRWEQTRSGFILKESQRLRHLRAKNSSLDTILKHSPLARAVADVFLAVSASKIAQVELSPRTSFSVQLPLPTSISVLPSLTEPQLPGIWLTTSNSVASADILDVDISTSRSRLAAHFALLLLAPPASIIADVSATNSPLAPKLAHYLQHTRPTKSFAQISQSSGISLADVQFLASHLIYWRRARAVPPLHHRDIYITSPNADMKRLRAATMQFSRAFPTLPILPKLLNMLSAGPRPYSTLIPSKDHKEAYMEILAWLLRGGWVTQLRSYAWVRVTPEVQERAKEIVKAEERVKEERRRKAALLEQEEERRITRRNKGKSKEWNEDGENESAVETSTEDGDTSSMYSGSSNRGGREEEKEDDDDDDDDPGEPDLPSGHLPSMESSMYSTNSGESVESTRTTIPVRSKLSHSRLSTVETVMYGDGKQEQQQQQQQQQKRSASGSQFDKQDSSSKAQVPALILSPARASGIETRYLTAIAAQMEEEDGHDAREAWETCLKYFNGEHAMEKIAVREGWKRKKVEALRARWRSRGVLLEVRHW